MELNIKTGSISNLTDARFFAAANVKYIGFDFRNKTETKLNIEEAKEIKDWLAGPDYILEFDDFDADLIFEYCSKLETKNIQLPSNKIVDGLEDYNLFVEIKNIEDLKTIASKIKANNLSIEIKNKKDFETAFEITNDAFYNLNVDFETQKEIIKKYDLKNIELVGKEEKEVGVKSYEDINDF